MQNSGRYAKQTSAWPRVQLRSKLHGRAARCAAASYQLLTAGRATDCEATKIAGSAGACTVHLSNTAAQPDRNLYIEKARSTQSNYTYKHEK